LSPYGSPWARLVENVAEDGDCWIGSGTPCRSGYVQIDAWIAGLGRRVRLSSHLCTYVLEQIGHAASWNELWLAYQEVRASKLELDHLCERPACRNPAHLELVTHQENEHRKHDRRAVRLEARGYEREAEEGACEF